MSWQRQTPRCGRVCRAWETIYSCRDCVLDNSCVMCQDCFQNSVHVNHTIEKRVSNGGTGCNCGEVEVWRRAPYCSKHAPAASGATARETRTTSRWQEHWEVPLHQQPAASTRGVTVKMEEPMCLIDTERDGRLSVQQGALQVLEQIQQPVVVVSVVGLYRTGKSYLMNRLAEKQRGFALGSTIESKTKGIWMWCVPHPKKDGHTLVLLDTEGLGDVVKGDEKHDTWIFCLAVLLSSTLVYNSMGTIDNTALEKLHFVTELTEHIRVKSTDHSKNTELMRIFPSFVWTVRDFSLDLELDGKRITADEYLDHSLKLKQGSTPEVERHNKVRQSLTRFFAVRRCFVMDRPANKEKMKRMEQVKDADLEPSFVEQANEFCNYIHQQAQVKTMRGGRGLTGRMLGSLAETYVEAIRSGKVPCLESAVESLAKIHNSRAVAEALEFYQEQMTQRVQFPTDTQEALSRVHTTVEKQAISIFIKASFNDQDYQHQKQLKASIEEKYGEFCKMNVKASRNLCGEVIRQVFASLESGLSNPNPLPFHTPTCSVFQTLTYTRPGGYRDFCSDLDHGVKCYRSQPGKGLMGEVVLTEYLKEKHVVGETIRKADTSLTEAQKREEAWRVRQEESKQQEQSLQERTRMQERALQDLKESNEENIRQLKGKMEEERRRNQEELDRLLTAKLQEQKELLERGFKGQAKELQDEIDKLVRDRRDADKPKLDHGFWSELGDGIQEIGTGIGRMGKAVVTGVGNVATSTVNTVKGWFGW
ncbi:guanylate-binding protein 1-like [Engraulis encrasicolus]|uniref:guanylate-binding protein 1-like n=1 Tax=Engraulis encrasicolus TaxID=184585 RepID=UPI002FD011EC